MVGSPEFAVTFKCSETSFAVLKDLPGLRPAPYLASRGLTWVQRIDRRTLGDAELRGYLRPKLRARRCGVAEKEAT